MKRLALLTAAVLAATFAAAPADAAKVRIGYWNSGASIGFGAFLKSGQFLEKQGLEVEYVTFPDVNAPTKAIAAGAIDFAIGASAGGSLSIAAQGLPVSIVLATQVAELNFVVLEDSPITSMEELKGKTIGMSPAGSATAAITASILAKNYGINPDDYKMAPGNDTRLAQFLGQKEIDAASLRTVTLALLPDLKVRTLSTFRKEWTKITGKDAPPTLAVGLMNNEWLKANPEAAAKAIAGMRNAFEAGKADKDAVAKALMEAGNIKEKNAKAYAALWDGIYTVSMDPATIQSLKTEFEVFKSVGVVKGDLPDSALNPAPYEASKAFK